MEKPKDKNLLTKLITSKAVRVGALALALTGGKAVAAGASTESGTNQLRPAATAPAPEGLDSVDTTMGTLPNETVTPITSETGNTSPDNSGDTPMGTLPNETVTPITSETSTTVPNNGEVTTTTAKKVDTTTSTVHNDPESAFKPTTTTQPESEGPQIDIDTGISRRIDLSPGFSVGGVSDTVPQSNDQISQPTLAFTGPEEHGGLNSTQQAGLAVGVAVAGAGLAMKRRQSDVLGTNPNK